MRQIVAACLALVGALACGESVTVREGRQVARAEISRGPHAVAVISVRDHGDIRVELLPELALETVRNFRQLALQGFYDGTQFHRVIPEFMIQGGDPNSKGHDPREFGKGGPGFTIDDEFTDLPQVRGVVSMANTGYPNSGGSQFFIVQRDTPELDGKYSAFGRVVSGMEVVDAITGIEIDKFGRYGPPDRPYPAPVVIESIRMEDSDQVAGVEGESR